MIVGGGGGSKSWQLDWRGSKVPNPSIYENLDLSDGEGPRVPNLNVVRWRVSVISSNVMYIESRLTFSVLP